MELGSALATFVPLWIFAPLILVGVIELFRTPKPTHPRRDSAISTTDYARA